MTLDHIEQFGCTVVQVKASGAGPGWSYTIGLYDTASRPELITVGLKPETAHHALNQAAEALRAGIDLTENRYRDMVGEVECEFRPVDPRWVEHLMGRALLYYGTDRFPVLQLIYPDLENRFPDEDGFDNRFAQPLLQPDAPRTTLEDDFWASADPASSLFDWRFPDPPHTRVFLSETVHQRTEPITFVSHDVEDGAWQFLGDRRADGGGPVISCFHHPVDDDPTLKELADLPLGWYAERTRPGESWERHPHKPELQADPVLDGPGQT